MMTFEEECGVVMIRAGSRFDPDIYTEALAELEKIAGRVGGWPHTVWDFRGVSLSSVDLPTAQKMRDIQRTALPERSGTKSAVVLDDVGNQMVVKLFRAISDSPRLDARLVGSMAEAMAWIKQAD